VRVKVDAQGVATCSTLSVVGLPVVGGVPEGVLQEGGEYYWELCMVGVRGTYRNQPAKKQGRPPNSNKASTSGEKRLGNGSTKRKQGTKQTAGQKDMPQPDTQPDTQADTDPQPRRKSVRASVPSVRARNRDSDPQSDDH